MPKSVIKGLNDLKKQLEKMQKAAKNLEGTKKVPLNELLTNKFIRKYTSFLTFDEMFNKFGYENLSQDDFDKLPKAELDSKVSRSSRFKTWDEMMDKAVEDYVSDKLGF